MSGDLTGMGDGLAVFAVGMLLFAAGAALRWALGQYFTFTVDVSADQQVVTSGPYRVLRHAGYTGGVIAMVGIGVIYANWIGFARFVLPRLTSIWRIRIEQAALLQTRRRAVPNLRRAPQASQPLIW